MELYKKLEHENKQNLMKKAAGELYGEVRQGYMKCIIK